MSALRTSWACRRINLSGPAFAATRSAQPNFRLVRDPHGQVWSSLCDARHGDSQPCRDAVPIRSNLRAICAIRNPCERISSGPEAG